MVFSICCYATGFGNCTLTQWIQCCSLKCAALHVMTNTHKIPPISSLNYTDLMTTEELEENLSRNQRLLSINCFITNSFHKLNLDNLLIHITIQGNNCTVNQTKRIADLLNSYIHIV